MINEIQEIYSKIKLQYEQATSTNSFDEKDSVNLEESLRYELTLAKNLFLTNCQSCTSIEQVNESAKILRKIENYINNRF